MAQRSGSGPRPGPHFVAGHATHTQWRGALALAAAQIDAALSRQVLRPTLGWAYFTEAAAPEADALMQELQARWPGVDWVGGVGIGIAACGAEYVEEPAVSLLLCDLPPASYRLFSGTAPLPGPAGGFAAHTACVHADPATPDVDELVAELAGRTAAGYLFGGLVSSRVGAVQVAGRPVRGGLSGVAFDASVGLVSRVTQGCQPVGPARTVTRAEHNLVLSLDDQDALPLLLADLDIRTHTAPREVMPRLQGTLVGLSDADEALLSRGGQFGADTRVRHLVGLDPARAAVAVADTVTPGMRLAFCRRDREAARRDLVRICAEIRDEVESDPDGRKLAGALYVSCTGRGGAHFGGPGAELQIVQHALGEVPLAGFFAAGEIARHHLYGYTGVLTVFTAPQSQLK